MHRMDVTFASREVYAGSISLFPTVRIADRQLPSILDIDVYFAALTTDGRLPLFTCECGRFDCGGYNVVVSRSPVAWMLQVPSVRGLVPRSPDAEEYEEQWMGFWLPGEEAYLLDFEDYSIPWPNVREVAGILLTLLRRLQQEHPGTRLLSASGGLNLVQRLAYYQTQLDAISRDIPSS